MMTYQQFNICLTGTDYLFLSLFEIYSEKKMMTLVNKYICYLLNRKLT